MIKQRTNLPSSHVSNKNWYSDEQISTLKSDAFKKGVDHFNQVYLKEYYDNINKAQEKGTYFFKIAEEKCSVHFKQIRLKSVSKSSFELIFIMSEDEFSSEEKYRCVHKEADNFITQEFDDDFSVVFSYMPSNELSALNDNEFLLNGFIFTYDPFRVEEKS